MIITEEAKSHFLNLYSIALSDTQIDSKELMLLYELGKKKGVKKERIEDLLLNADKVVFTIPKDLLTKIEYLYEFAQMIWVDGQIDEFEKKSLEKFCYKFGFELNNITRLSEFLLKEAQNESTVAEVKVKVKHLIGNI